MDTENKQRSYFQRYSKKIFNVLLIVTLLWSLLFAGWIIYNFNELDNVNMTNYFRCFVHTSIRNANVMKIGAEDCNYVNTTSLFKIIKNKIML
jgi:predicted negative regulator of RcsB-dependent stress response